MSPFLTLHSFCNRLVFEFNRTLKWSKKNYREKAAEKLKKLTDFQKDRIGKLKKKYNVDFEKLQHQLGAMENYLYLDLLDKARTLLSWNPPADGAVVDAGSKNFYYVGALDAFFQPKQITGIELEGYCIYQDLHSRSDYAHYYISAYPQARYLVMDFCEYREKADIITYFYPFVTKEEFVDWTLPLKFFNPSLLFQHIADTLNPGGFYFMINHGPEEGKLGFQFAENAGLNLIGTYTDTVSLIHRVHPPVVSVWIKPADKSGT